MDSPDCELHGDQGSPEETLQCGFHCNLSIEGKCHSGCGRLGPQIGRSFLHGGSQQHPRLHPFAKDLRGEDLVLLPVWRERSITFAVLAV